jgi:hypothetical protein
MQRKNALRAALVADHGYGSRCADIENLSDDQALIAQQQLRIEKLTRQQRLVAPQLARAAGCTMCNTRAFILASFLV